MEPNSTNRILDAHAGRLATNPPLQPFDMASMRRVIEKATIYRSRTPKAVVYISQADAQAHTAAYEAWPHQPKEPVGMFTPAWAGHDERERHEELLAEDREAARQEAAEFRAEREWGGE